MTLLDKGATNRALADTLVVTLDTVKRHATDILEGLGVATGSRAVALVRDLGLLLWGSDLRGGAEPAGFR